MDTGRLCFRMIQPESATLPYLLCSVWGVSEGNVYLINVRACVYYICLLVRMHLGDLRGF